MDYAYELENLLNWIEAHNACTRKELEEGIRNLSDAERRDPNTPAPSCLQWKLKYLELDGYLVQRYVKRGNRWKYLWYRTQKKLPPKRTISEETPNPV